MDDLIRTAVFNWLEKLTWEHGGILPRDLLEQGIEFQGRRIILIGPQGIWKPRIMELPLSITTTPGNHYDDQLLADGMLVYSYRGEDPTHRDNVGLRAAMQAGKPLVYFYGVVPGKYLAEWPVYVVNDIPGELCFTIAFDERSSLLNQYQKNRDYSIAADSTGENRRRYATTLALARLHQGEFRIKVLAAYQEQCTFCRLRHQQLLDAAHIIPDGEKGGEPLVPNGLSLCKIHHAAFDRNIIGLTPDYKIMVRKDILEEVDGPMLKHGIQELHDQKIILPGRRKDWPDRTKLSIRYERFIKAS